MNFERTSLIHRSNNQSLNQSKLNNVSYYDEKKLLHRRSMSRSQSPNPACIKIGTHSSYWLPKKTYDNKKSPINY